MGWDGMGSDGMGLYCIVWDCMGLCDVVFLFIPR